VDKNYSFTSKARDCFKCAIFVARLYCCYKHSGVTTLSDRLMTKVKGCLSIMEDHIPKKSSDKKKKTKAADPIPPVESIPVVLEKTTLGKKKRGRPAKASKTPESSQMTKDAVPVTSDGKKKRKVVYKDDDFGEEEFNEVVVPHSTTIRARPPSKAAVAVSLSGPSMQRLISRFEEQYEEMGKRYLEMGNILQQMKEAAARGRERTEEEIRADLLEEVQRNILKSLPKK
jgi:hypothetical protein